jgi:general stress protein 26
VARLGTHRRTRKVDDIRTDPRVALYYLAPGAAGYVSLTGTARIVDDPHEAARRWKEEWEQYYADRQRDYVLIEVTPLRLEVVDYRLDLTGDPATWMPPSVEFPPAPSKR